MTFVPGYHSDDLWPIIRYLFEFDNNDGEIFMSPACN